MKFLLGLIIGFLIIPAAVFIYFQSGNAPVATSDPPLPFEKSLASRALHARINRQMPARDVSGMKVDDLQAAAMTYQMNCSFCHGLPQKPISPAAKGMFPQPPQLFKAGEMVTDDPPGETYWKVKNGIRLSGMPGFRDTLSEQDIWQVTALVARADKLPQQVLDALKPSGESSAMPPEPAPPPKTKTPPEKTPPEKKR
jgi:thiosulfate dehydrogenase